MITWSVLLKDQPILIWYKNGLEKSDEEKNRGDWEEATKEKDGTLKMPKDVLFLGQTEDTSGLCLLQNTDKDKASEIGLIGDLVKSHFRGVTEGGNGD